MIENKKRVLITNLKVWVCILRTSRNSSRNFTMSKRPAPGELPSAQHPTPPRTPSSTVPAFLCPEEVLTSLLLQKQNAGVAEEKEKRLLQSFQKS